jgi:hypothetical protein
LARCSRLTKEKWGARGLTTNPTGRDNAESKLSFNAREVVPGFEEGIVLMRMTTGSLKLHNFVYGKRLERESYIILRNDVPTRNDHAEMYQFSTGRGGQRCCSID